VGGWVGGWCECARLDSHGAVVIMADQVHVESGLTGQVIRSVPCVSPQDNASVRRTREVQGSRY
jgi:hypothetical protein